MNNENTQTAGHHGTSGGLRGHSTGALYPISCVGRIVDGRTWWQPTNLETGVRWPKGYRRGEHAEQIARGMLEQHRTGYCDRILWAGAGIEGVSEITLDGHLNVDARRVQP